MNMSDQGKCCDLCFHSIARSSPRAAKTWIDICQLTNVFGNLFGLQYFHKEEIRDLELLGFVQTTDTKECIMIKVLGEQLDPFGNYFCGGKCGDKDL